jgi:folate-binding protein YgfZ
LLRQGCGLVDRLWVEHLELVGEDRVRFLNGMVTGDVKALEAGDGLFAFFTSAQGRILAEARIEALAESLILELPSGCTEPIVEHLSRYVVADRVELVPRPELRVLSLVGPEAARVVARIGPGELPFGKRWGAGPAAAPVGFVAAEALRIEAGCARFGPDFGSERFPQEVGETDALDFDKGCYLGQEVVARIHYRGKVNHRLCGLRLSVGTLPTAGSAVDLEGETVGSSGSAVVSPGLERGIALAVLHRKVEPGAGVTVAGVEAEVVDLPFVDV